MSQTTATRKLAINGAEPLRTRPFPQWPVFGKEEEDALLEVFRSGKWWYGEKVREFEEKYAAFHGAKHGVTCCNGTIAIELAMKAMGLQPGDEVLVPAYTFIATATAVATAQGVPVFVDVDPNTVNMNIKEAAKALTPKTRAIAVVHFAGLPVDMDAVMSFAKEHNLLVLEDSAHAWGSQWKGKGVGAIGDMGTFSFQMSKNITAAEGGIILTDNDELAAMARSLTNCGRKEGGAWYLHYNLGGNYRITELQAAILIAQLERLGPQTALREKNAAILNNELAKIPGLTPQPLDPRITRRSYHLYVLRFEADKFGISREVFLKALTAEGVPNSQGYLTPVYKNPCFLDGFDGRYRNVFCPAAEALCAGEEVWMPHAMLLGTEEDMWDVVNAVKKIHENQAELA